MPDRSIDWLRWLFYLLGGVPLLVWIFATRDRVARVAVVAAVTILIQDLFMGRRYFWAFSLGPGLMVAYLALMARVLENRRLPQVGQYGALWLAFLFFAGFGVIVGSLGTNLLQINIQNYQFSYLEGLCFFLFGAAALRRPEELQRFFQLFVLLGATAALFHLSSQATGFRFRGIAASDDPIYYGAVFNNTNSLGAFYVLVIPPTLVIAMRARISPLMRWIAIVALVLMSGSLLMTGSRGGLLCTFVMCGVAMVYAQLGAGRAVMTMMAGAVLTALGFFLISSLLSENWAALSKVMREEGAQTDRLTTWYYFGRMLLAKPLGTGLAGENLTTAVAQYGLHGVSSAHNIYLDIGLQTGLAGLAVFSTMAFSIVNRNRFAIRAVTDPAAREGLTLLLIALLGYLAVGFFEPIYTVDNKLNTLYWLLAGLSVGAAQTVAADQRAVRESALDAERHAPLSLPAHAHRQL